MLEVESRAYLSKSALSRVSPMEVFDRHAKKHADYGHSDLASKKKLATSIVKSTIKTESVTVVENGGKPSEDPTSSTSPAVRVQVALERTFGRVVISLENLIIPEHRLHPTPSMVEGLDARTEWYLRRLGCDFIQHSGILLKLPQTAMATAQVLYQRFYHVKSFLRHDYFTIAIACIYLASKVEEFPKRLRDIINVFTHVKQTICGEPIEPVILDYGYVALKNQVIKCERRLLKELGFCVHVKHPHKLICMYLQVLKLDENNTFVQRAWNYMNDSLRTDLFVRYSPEAVACGCIFLTARKLQIPLPHNSSWSSLFGVTKNDMEDIATNILLLYSIKLPSVGEIEAKIGAMRKALDVARAKGPLANVIDVEAEKTPDSIRTTPEDVLRAEPEVNEVREKDSKDRIEKRPREPSGDPSGERLVRDAKRHRSPRNTQRSRSRSGDRQRSRDVRSKERRPSRSPQRPREKTYIPRGSSPLVGSRRDRISPPRRERERDRDGRRRSNSRSREGAERRRSRSRSPHRRNRRH